MTAEKNVAKIGVYHTFTGFPIVRGGGMGGRLPNPTIFFENSPIKTYVRPMEHPQLKNEAPPSEKQPPSDWKVKHPFMK